MLLVGFLKKSIFITVYMLGCVHVGLFAEQWVKPGYILPCSRCVQN